MVNLKGTVKKMLCIALCIVLCSTQGSFMSSEAASLPQKDLIPKSGEVQLTLKGALEQAFKSNKTLLTTKNQWQAKNLEIEGIKNKLEALAKNPEGLKLDTLSNLETDEAKKKAASEIVALISALNLKQDELKTLEWDYGSAINTMTYNVKVLFYDLLENTETYAYEVENSNKLEEAYLKLYPLYLQGLVKTEVVKTNRDNYKGSQERQVKTLLAIDQLKAKLTTQLGGIDIGSWTYDGNLPDFSISEEALSQLYPYGVHHEVQLLTLEKNLNNSQRLLEEMNDIYLLTYGEQGKWIFPVINDYQVDYPLLFENFNNMTASKPKEEIKSVYPLRYGFYKLNTLKEYFKEVPEVLSLMEEQSPLTEALSQREERKGLVTEGYTTLQKNYRAAYEAYKQLEFDLEEIRESLIIHTAILEKLKKSNLMGLTAYSEVQTMMIKVSDQKRSERVLHIKLNKSIAELDFVSAGAVRALGNLKGFEQLSSGYVLTEGINNSGTSGAATKPEEAIRWLVENPTDFYGFEFSLSVPNTLKATQYQLFDADGKALGEPVEVSESFRHGSLPYGKDSTLKLIIYQKDKTLKTFILSLDKISGRL